MAVAVSVQNLSKRYDRVEALRGVSFEVQRGEIFGLLGPNGAGKTTTLECLVGLRTFEDGQIVVSGIDVRAQPREARQRIGVALQTTALQDKITPREALALFGAFYREPADVSSLLERFALREKADVAFDSLSGGQRQRLALALAFVNQPEVVLLDEPTAGLDPQARRELHREIQAMKADGHTVLLTTHYLEEAEQLCDRIGIIGRGRVITTGTPRELIEGFAGVHLVTAMLAKPIDATRVAQLPGAREIEVSGTSVRFQASDPTRAVAGLIEAITGQENALAELSVRKASLEDVFLRLTGETENAAHHAKEDVR
jgi:ABC-2 type transport system ATP-binding protein